MKRIFPFLLLLLALCGCEKKMGVWDHSEGKLKVLSTIAMIDDLVAQVGGDHVLTQTLIQGELDPHSYEMVKGDDEKFAQADLIFYNGLGLEHGVSLRQNLEGNEKAVGVADTLLDESPELILKVDGQYDPHVWMDIALWKRTVPPIVTALCKKDPTHAQEYEERGEKLMAEMERADEAAFARLQGISEERRYLVTSHDAFNYFTRHYLAAEGEGNWEMRCASPEGLAPEAQLSVTDIMEIIDHVETFGVSVLFPESNVNKEALSKIVSAGKEKGLQVRMCREELYGDAMGKGSYLEMIAHNVEVIAREMSR